jgi:hypothetical protein
MRNNWVNCWATIVNTWAPGTTLQATLNKNVGQTQIVCASSNSQNCNSSGNTVYMICESGCYPGTQVSWSLLGTFTSAPQPTDWTVASASLPPTQASAPSGQQGLTPLVANADTGTVACAPQATARRHGGLSGMLQAAQQNISHLLAVVWG